MDTHRRESLTRKHLAERRRRAKINYYLDEIEALISPTGTQMNAVKMEKAELLEKTVAYLKQVKSKSLDATQQFQYQQAALLSSQAKAFSQFGFTSMVVRPHYQALQEPSPLNLTTSPVDLEVQQTLESSKPEVSREVERSRSLTILESDSFERTVSFDFDGITSAHNVREDDNSRESDTSAEETEEVVKKELFMEEDIQTHESERPSDSVVWRPWSTSS